MPYFRARKANLNLILTAYDLNENAASMRNIYFRVYSLKIYGLKQVILKLIACDTDRRRLRKM